MLGPKEEFSDSWIESLLVLANVQEESGSVTVWKPGKRSAKISRRKQ
jgi:hypothetical protein